MPPSKLGALIRSERQAKAISLREFAKRIGKSPAFVTELECEPVPTLSEETMKKVAEELGIDEAKLFVLAERIPRDLAPTTETEYALYRRVKSMPTAEQEKTLRSFNRGRAK